MRGRNWRRVVPYSSSTVSLGRLPGFLKSSDWSSTRNAKPSRRARSMMNSKSDWLFSRI